MIALLLLGQQPRPMPADMAQVYAAKVRDLRSALANNDHPEALEAARALIDKVIVHPPVVDGDLPSVELVGELMAILSTAGVSASQLGVQSATSDSVLSVFVSSVKEAPPISNKTRTCSQFKISRALACSS